MKKVKMTVSTGMANSKVSETVEMADDMRKEDIDCYFEEDDGIVLIDYKNSYMGNGTTEEEISERYRNQIQLYREALEKASGKAVKEAYLYMFDLKKFIKIK